MTSNWPKTVNEAVNRLINDDLDADQIDELRQLPPDQRILCHMTLGRWIRNNYGLWQGNQELLADTKEAHPDDASWVILDRLFMRLTGPVAFSIN